MLSSIDAKDITIIAVPLESVSEPFSLSLSTTVPYFTGIPNPVLSLLLVSLAL